MKGGLNETIALSELKLKLFSVQDANYDVVLVKNLLTETTTALALVVIPIRGRSQTTFTRQSG